MRLRRIAAAAFLLLGVAVATMEESLVHTDDGCVVETHCNACLLQLGTRGVVTEAFSLPRVAAAVDCVSPAPPPSPEDEPPRCASSRGPPAA